MKKIELQEKTNLMLAKHLVTEFDIRRFVNWAIDLMLDGYQGEELDILAGLDEGDSREAEHYFERVADQLGLVIEKDEDKLIELYVMDVAQQVVDGTISPRKGQQQVTEIYYKLDYFPGYSDIVYADDYWYINNQQDEIGYEEYLLNEFKQLSSKNY